MELNNNTDLALSGRKCKENKIKISYSLIEGGIYMGWLERMNSAINYIEENLTEEIDNTKVAEIACCSVYNFQRIFSFMTDIPLSEYIRRRRFTLAALELQNSAIKIIDLALKYGYQSPEAFSRAFQNMHGVTPTIARNQGVYLKAYPCISFQISIRGDVEMNYRIEKKGTLSVFGVEEVFTNFENDENLKAIPEFWQNEIKKGTLDRITKASGIKWNSSCKGIGPINAVMCYRDTGGNTFPYMICAFTPVSGVPKGFTYAEIPALTWVIFKTEEHTEDKTSGVIQALWKRIYTEWFPTSDYEPLDGPEFEMYGVSENGKKYCEIWIPVK
ncbi:AraC family transcriptional regulator [Halocella sp. SP3-1]|uniref:AraC family transcriptional regulator n=1 Tax=Halocella sp. SP3-1 TaxID=2382161 RepID=UPI00197AED9F|nr:AraC family transcriptional regulator [Halocella sp. SP3-1]